MTEEQLLRRLKEHRPEGLEALILRYNRYVCSVIGAVLGSGGQTEDIEELASDVFLAVWNHAEALKPGKLRPYLGAAARNAAKSFLRKRRELPMDLDEIPAISDQGAGSPENLVLRREQSALVRQAIDSMGQPDREIFLRYYYYLQTSGQIAAEMDMEPSTVRTRLMRGRNALKAALWKEDIL